ncbi:unnamed protein product, partial [Rotaria sordida]
KIDEVERQSSNEKLLRTTLFNIQSDLETNYGQHTNINNFHYEKRLKNLRDELANVRKFRNNQEKYNKTFEYLHLI